MYMNHPRGLGSSPTGERCKHFAEVGNLLTTSFSTRAAKKRVPYPLIKHRKEAKNNIPTFRS